MPRVAAVSAIVNAMMCLSSVISSVTSAAARLILLPAVVVVVVVPRIGTTTAAAAAAAAAAHRANAAFAFPPPRGTGGGRRRRSSAPPTSPRSPFAFSSSSTTAAAGEGRRSTCRCVVSRASNGNNNTSDDDDENDDDENDDDENDDDENDDDENETTTLGMERIYSEWTIEDDELLYDNRDRLSTVRLASILGRGMHGVEARLKKLSDVKSAAYSRLFGSGRRRRRRLRESSSDDDDGRGGGGGAGGGGGGGGGLTPAGEVLRRIRWDMSIPSSSFAVLHYDRVRDCIVETPFDAPNDAISGKETSFVFALPEHRIVGVKYLDRIVWDRGTKLDRVFGSMNGNGMTIDVVIETYDDWRKERDGRIERDRMRQIEVLNELKVVLGEGRLGLMKEYSSKLIRGEWDGHGGGGGGGGGGSVREYVKSVGGLYYDARRENDSVEEDGDAEEGGTVDDDGTDIIDFLHLFSDLVALLPDESLREEVLNEVESVVERSRGGLASTSTGKSVGTTPPPELNEDDLEEKFVKGSGAGGQKVNKTSNRVILTHIPTQVRVECQDTRSLQQNRKIARKRLRLKVDAFLNGERSIVVQKARVAVVKKAKNKDRNKRRRQQKENEPDA